MTSTAIPWPEPMPDRRAAFEALIRRHQTGAWRYLRALGAAADEADDLLQEVFLVAWRKGLEDRGPAATAAFLRLTGKNLFLRRRRDRGRAEALLVELADRRWHNECGRDDGEAWLAALETCLDALQPRAREGVERWYRGERDRTAAALGLSANGLKTLLQRARASLRECIERRLGEPGDER